MSRGGYRLHKYCQVDMICFNNREVNHVQLCYTTMFD